MTLEEMNRTIQFLIEHSAQFSNQMEQMSIQMAQMKVHHEQVAARHDRDHEALFRGLNDLRESTARFQTWAAEVVAIESNRLDRHDQLHQDELDFQRQALHLLHRILDKL